MLELRTCDFQVLGNVEALSEGRLSYIPEDFNYPPDDSTGIIRAVGYGNALRQDREGFKAPGVSVARNYGGPDPRVSSMTACADLARS